MAYLLELEYEPTGAQLGVGKKEIKISDSDFAIVYKAMNGMQHLVTDWVMFEGLTANQIPTGICTRGLRSWRITNDNQS